MTDYGDVRGEHFKEKEKTNPYAPFKPPFKYDEMGNYIFDSEGNMIVDVRGWGFLTGIGAMGYDQEKAMRIQDGIGHRIARIMTEDAN